MPDLPNRQILLRRRPTGLVQRDDTELVTAPAPEPAESEALVRTTYVGLDAAVRTWLNDQPGYLPPVQLGEVIRAGDIVTTLTGFQEYVIARDDVFSTPIPGKADVDQLAVTSQGRLAGASAWPTCVGQHNRRCAWSQ